MFVAPIEQYRVTETAVKFNGGKQGVAASCFVTEHPEGRGADLHLHPYAELFVVLDGTAEFTAGQEQRVVEGGHFVIVPPETPHGFRCLGDRVLRIVSIHPSPEVVQTDL